MRTLFSLPLASSPQPLTEASQPGRPSSKSDSGVRQECGLRFAHGHQQPRQLRSVTDADQDGVRNSCCSHAIADICSAPVRQVDCRSSPRCSYRGEMLLPRRILLRALLRCASSAILTPSFLLRRADTVAWKLPVHGAEHRGTAAALAAQAPHGAAKGGAAAVPQPFSRPVHVLAPGALAACSSACQIDDRPLCIRFEYTGSGCPPR